MFCPCSICNGKDVIVTSRKMLKKHLNMFGIADNPAVVDENISVCSGGVSSKNLCSIDYSADDDTDLNDNFVDDATSYYCW